MDDVKLRQAVQADLPAIWGLVRQTGINPLGLDWRRFLVAESPSGEFIGCGPLKPHFDGSLELASLAVVPAWRGRGVARLLIQLLMEKASRPLYLVCRGLLGALYEKFGFRVIQPVTTYPFQKHCVLERNQQDVRIQGCVFCSFDNQMRFLISLYPVYRLEDR